MTKDNFKDFVFSVRILVITFPLTTIEVRVTFLVVVVVITSVRFLLYIQVRIIVVAVITLVQFYCNLKTVLSVLFKLYTCNPFTSWDHLLKTICSFRHHTIVQITSRLNQFKSQGNGGCSSWQWISRRYHGKIKRGLFMRAKVVRFTPIILFFSGTV
jgi:hypothetical protein